MARREEQESNSANLVTCLVMFVRTIYLFYVYLVMTVNCGVGFLYDPDSAPSFCGLCMSDQVVYGPTQAQFRTV